MKVSVFKLYLLLKSGIVSSHIFISFPPNTLRLTFSPTFLFSITRPSSGRKPFAFKHSYSKQESRAFDRGVVYCKGSNRCPGPFLILGTQAGALNIDQAFILIAVIKLHKTNIALEKISPQFINSRVSSLSIVASMPFRDTCRFINRLYIKLDFDVSILTLNLTWSKIRCVNPY